MESETSDFGIRVIAHLKGQSHENKKNINPDSCVYQTGLQKLMKYKSWNHLMKYDMIQLKIYKISDYEIYYG